MRRKHFLWLSLIALVVVSGVAMKLHDLIAEWRTPAPTPEKAAAQRLKALNGFLSRSNFIPDGVLVHLTGSQVTADDLRTLSGLDRVGELYVSRCGLGDAGLDGMGGFPHLVVLELPDNVIWGQGLDGLRGLTKLQVLTLSDNPVADKYLPPVAALTGLSILDLDGTSVTDAGIKDVARLGSLTRLNLARTGITDEAVPDLARLAALRHLDLSYTAVTERGAAALKLSLPNCRILITVAK